MRSMLVKWLPRTGRWGRSLAALVVLAILLAGCEISLASSESISNSGSPIVISNQTQGIYLASNCDGPTVITIKAGTNLVDIGPASSTCEEVAYPTEAGYTEIGYVPVYTLHRATNSIRCINPNGCHVHTGPSPTAPILSTLRPGDRVQGRGTAITGAIITDGTNYSWWEVIDPVTGKPGDIYGTLVIAF